MRSQVQDRARDAYSAQLYLCIFTGAYLKIYIYSGALTDLEEVQEAGFGGTRLPDHRHGRAEVVHKLTVGVQHHGLGELGTRYVKRDRENKPSIPHSPTQS